jgi:hypothetical protein
MAKYRSKPVAIEASQWFKDGDHPAVVFIGTTGGQSHLTNRFAVSSMQGWVAVDPGDWIIQEPFGGGHYPCKADVFANKYEQV